MKFQCRRVLWSFFLVGIVATMLAVRAADRPIDDRVITAPRFSTLQVFADPGGAPLAAWQIRVEALTGVVRIVGIEGGSHSAYRDAPYYDTRAIQHDRVILGMFSLAADLPTTRTRLATIHIMIEGEADPAWSIQLDTAATADGVAIQPHLELITEPAP